MKHIKATFISELIKLKRSKIVWITIGLFIFIPLMMGLLMYVAQNPEISAKLGLIGTKATIFGENDWNGFFTIINQIIATIGLIGFGFVTAWVFGREYIEKTMVDILALPAKRSSIVISKFLIISLWCIILIFVLFITGLLTGFIIDIPGWSKSIFIENSKIFFLTAFLTLLLSSPVAFFACYGRGIIAPLGFVIISLIMAQFVSLVGLGPYFPWAIPGVLTVPEGTEGMEIIRASYLIVIITGIIGVLATIRWWQKADQH